MNPLINMESIDEIFAKIYMAKLKSVYSYSLLHWIEIQVEYVDASYVYEYKDGIIVSISSRPSHLFTLYHAYFTMSENCLVPYSGELEFEPLENYEGNTIEEKQILQEKNGIPLILTPISYSNMFRTTKGRLVTCSRHSEILEIAFEETALEFCQIYKPKILNSIDMLPTVLAKLISEYIFPTIL